MLTDVQRAELEEMGAPNVRAHLLILAPVEARMLTASSTDPFIAARSSTGWRQSTSTMSFGSD
jgi:hypothetical protein